LSASRNGSATQPTFWHAPELAKAGYPVFPVNGKEPTVEGGFYACSTDMSQIAEWIEDGHEDNDVAIPTGLPSGVVVIDADTPETYSKMEEEYGPEAIAARVARIPQGKRHEHLRHLCGVLLARGVAVGDAEDVLIAAWMKMGGELAERAEREIPNTLATTEQALAEGHATGVPSLEKITPGLYAELGGVFGWKGRLVAGGKLPNEGEGPRLCGGRIGRRRVLRRLLASLERDGRPPYEVRGDVVGRDRGREPLLRNCESEEISLPTPVVLDPPEDLFFYYMMGWSRFRLLRAIEGWPEIARAVPGNPEDGAFTHGLLVSMRDPRGMHARPAALLFACLRRASPGTRVGFEFGGRTFDLGEASQVRVNAILRLLVQPGERVLALTSGPDAEQLLWAVAEVFAFRPGDHTSDWLRISALVGGQEEARAIMGEIRNAYVEILRDTG
jgi:phosphotransferase system HPr-like phosphotransfer protein